MTLRVVFRRAAISEFEDAAVWYDDKRPGLGEEFIREIDDAVAKAAVAPQRYPVVFGDIRRTVARRFPFAVYFRVRSDALVGGEVARAIHWRILNDPSNRLGDFTSEKTRARRQPLTYYRIEKTIFRHLLSPIPSAVEFQSDEDSRDVEERNLVRLMTIIAEEGLVGRWDPDKNDALHQRTERVFSAGAVRAWVRILRDVLNAHLQLYLKGPDEVSRVLYRTLSEDQFLLMKRFVRRIFAHSVWDAPDTADQDISKALTKDDDTTAFNLLKERNLAVEWILQGASV